MSGVMLSLMELTPKQNLLVILGLSAVVLFIGAAMSFFKDMKELDTEEYEEDADVSEESGEEPDDEEMYFSGEIEYHDETETKEDEQEPSADADMQDADEVAPRGPHYQKGGF